MAKIKKKTNSHKGKFKHSETSVIDAVRGMGRWAVGDTPSPSGGIITTICDRLGCTRKTFYEYLEKRPAIKEAYEDEKESMLDVAEEQLMNLIMAQELGAICFYLKCKGKQRGYVEKQEIAANVNNRTSMIVTPEKFKSVDAWEAFLKEQ